MVFGLVAARVVGKKIAAGAAIRLFSHSANVAKRFANITPPPMAESLTTAVIGLEEINRSDERPLDVQ